MVFRKTIRKPKYYLSCVEKLKSFGCFNGTFITLIKLFLLSRNNVVKRGFINISVKASLCIAKMKRKQRVGSKIESSHIHRAGAADKYQL